MYMIHYKHLDVIIMNSDGRHWEAFLPSGCFAQSNSKGLTIILACSEIDSTSRDLELEEEQKDANWYKKYFPDLFPLKNKFRVEKSCY